MRRAGQGPRLPFSLPFIGSVGLEMGKETPFFFLSFCHFLGPLSRHMGGSQARGPVGAVAASLCQSHSNAGSKPSLQPTPQLTAMPDPYPTEQVQGSNLQPHGSYSDSLTTAPRQELQESSLNIDIF